MMKMRQVDRKVDSIVADLIDTRIFPTEKMTQNTSNLVHNSTNLLCSNDPIIKFSSQCIASAMISPHYTNLFYRFSIINIWSWIIIFWKYLISA
ncbi:hypothetical protein BH23THE1_BH23THE1_02540 [soil metagenome]